MVVGAGRVVSGFNPLHDGGAQRSRDCSVAKGSDDRPKVAIASVNGLKVDAAQTGNPRFILWRQSPTSYNTGNTPLETAHVPEPLCVNLLGF